MDETLKNWLNTVHHNLNAQGISVLVVDGKQPNSYGINLDSNQFVGGIFYWPKGTYEAQFNDCDSGEVILLETVYFDEPKLLEKYLEQLIFERLTGYLITR